MLAAVIATIAVVRLIPLPEGPGPLHNPLKGYAPFDRSEGTFGPSAMTFIYVPWRDLEPTPGQYAFEAFENRRWNTKNTVGKRFVLRVYLDYPNRPTGVPDWLVEQGVNQKSYDRGPRGHNGKGLSPDYESPVLRQGLVRLIQAMGNRWDSHPRVGFIQLGLLGHYGEWHTWPNRELFASHETQKAVVEAYRTSFPNTKLMARYGYLPSVQSSWMGFHDDMFPEDTLPEKEWHFLSGLAQGKVDDNWKTAPIGGEMAPRQAHKWLGEGWSHTKKAVVESHFTWIGGYCPAMEDTNDPQFIARRNELISLLGYEFRWVSAVLPQTAVSEKPVKFSLEGVNQGVAPFYYPWKVRFALLDNQGVAALQWNSSVDIRKWLPGRFRLDTTATDIVAPGEYEVGVQIVDPATNLGGIKFANQLSEKSGFTVVGTVSVN